MEKFNELLSKLKELEIIQTKGEWTENLPGIWKQYFENNFREVKHKKITNNKNIKIMKSKITPDTGGFTPFNIEIEVETKKEALDLFLLFNNGDYDVWSQIRGKLKEQNLI